MSTGGELAYLQNRIAQALAMEAMRQRAIGARAAYGRMMQGMVARLRAMDRNEDGRITEREFLGGMLQFFDRLDGNNDGAIGPAELRQAHSRMAGPALPGNPEQRMREFGGPDNDAGAHGGPGGLNDLGPGPNQQRQ